MAEPAEADNSPADLAQPERIAPPVPTGESKKTELVKVSDSSTARRPQKPTLALAIQPTEWIGLLFVCVAVVVLGYLTEEWLGLIGVAVTVVGVELAVRQILVSQEQIGRTLTAAEATRRAVTTTEAQIARNDLMALVHNLQRHDRDLGQAIRGKADADVVARHLSDWRDDAYRFVGLLQAQGMRWSNDELLEALINSAKLAGALTVDLADSPDDRRIVTKALRSETQAVCGQLSILDSQLRSTTGQDHDAA